jgi:Arc/MetJ-type ribon-helix-helix transcriptional regulator
MEIDLPPELAAQINDLIRTGDYKDVLDVIIHAVALLYEEPSANLPNSSSRSKSQ